MRCRGKSLNRTNSRFSSAENSVINVPLMSSSLVGRAGANSTKFSWFMVFLVSARVNPSPIPMTAIIRSKEKRIIAIEPEIENTLPHLPIY